jgi:hypothetical protein
MKVLALFALTLIASATHAQTANSAVINAGGTSSSQGHIVVDWSVGELALVNTVTSIDNQYIITNGFLQPELPRANNSHHFSGDEVKILPNYGSGRIEVHFMTRQMGTLNMQVFDASGKLLLTSKAVSNGVGSVERFNLSSYAAGTYFLKIDLQPSLGSVGKSGSYKIVRL